MDSEIVETITGWDQTPFSGGYQGLRDLADAEFSGAVTQGTAWGFMLNGRLIGIEDGSLSTFDRADGTAYESPTPALPLLYAMQSTAEKQTQYYTNKKPIAEADNTLSSGNFTGFIELSENVLSGDYYTVYYGGRSLSVAFVGNSRKLLTDDDAFERADDEVGIYTVYAADLEVIDLPDTEPSHEESTQEDSESSEPPTTENEHADESTAATPEESTPAADSEPAGAASSGSTPTHSSTADTAAATESTEAGASDSPPKTTGQSSSPSPTHSTHRTGPNSTEPSGVAGSQSADQQSTGVFSDEAEWRNTKTIPSLDPSDDSDREQSVRRQPAPQKTRQSKSSASRRQLQKRLKRAEQIMQKAETRHERLVEERDTARAERDEAQQKLETLSEKLSEANAEVERLEAQLESGSAGTPTVASTGGRTMSTDEALAGTNLLVRYASKGDGTLEDAISGSVSQEDIMANLRIEPHTTFEREGLAVDGQPFESFLEGRIELAFVRWLTEELLFDIQQTGNQNELSGIYETLPAINRAELQGTVSLGTDEEGDELTAAFDLVVRDKRDRPLFIADFNESKQPVSNGMINSLVRDGSELVQRNESFTGAFAVTTSYYEGAALDAAADATGGGLLSASRGKSFVYISRKQGFHLCLVEQLGDTFDLHVPEL